MAQYINDFQEMFLGNKQSATEMQISNQAMY